MITAKLTKLVLSMVVTLPMVLTTASCAGSAAGESASATGNSVSGDSHLSRVQLYDSLSAMAGDSDAVVVGTASSQEVVADLGEMTDFTLANFTVEAVVKPGGGIQDDSSIVLRQLGSEKQLPPVPLLKMGEPYLLYLTAWVREGQETQYYVTGASAGIYSMQATQQNESALRVLTEADSPEGEIPVPDLSFQRVDDESGDTLPESVALEDALG